MNYYFITTEHLENRIWFRDDEDYKVAMNKVALVAGLMDIRVLSFILMSNHVHFLIEASDKAEAERFITEFKNQYARYVRHKYGTKELLRRNSVEIQPVENLDEAVERVIAYIQMNCVAANICSHPSLYPWGTGNCFFAETKRRGVRLDTLSKRARKKLLHSRWDLSGNCHLGVDGYILPESYIQVQQVESIFWSAKRYNYFLNASSKAKRRLETGEAPSFKDPVVLAGMEDLCHSLFRREHIWGLSDKEQAELLRQLSFRFSSNVEQLSRISGIGKEKVVKLLDSV